MVDHGILRYIVNILICSACFAKRPGVVLSGEGVRQQDATSLRSSWPATAPTEDALLGGSSHDPEKAPAYLGYDDQWKPDGTVHMMGSCPGLHGSWRAVCYTPEKAASLGIDMQGFR